MYFFLLILTIFQSCRRVKYIQNNEKDANKHLEAQPGGQRDNLIENQLHRLKANPSFLPCSLLLPSIALLCLLLPCVPFYCLLLPSTAFCFHGESNIWKEPGDWYQAQLLQLIDVYQSQWQSLKRPRSICKKKNQKDKSQHK